MKNRLIQAYKQAPWRVQLQWIGLFLLGLVTIASVAGIYLNISARTSTIGRNIQQMEAQSEQIERNIADMQTTLAMITSAAVMQKRAEEMGFVPAEPGNEVYVTVPSYYGRQPAMLAPPPGPGMVNPPLVQPSYTESLWDWLFQGVVKAAQMQGKVIP